MSDPTIAAIQKAYNEIVSKLCHIETGTGTPYALIVAARVIGAAIIAAAMIRNEESR